MSNSPVAVTFFPNYAAKRKAEQAMTLPGLAERIGRSTAPRKADLPWLKLARFGDRRTVNGCLRHDANILAVSGIEADYDAERMAFDEARDLLVQQGIASIIYTSPSHTEDAPRWRVLCPLSEEMPAARRSHHLGRLNGLFRGAFAGESWTLSQSYYFGSVNWNPSHHVEVIDGQAIDQHDDLDTIWLGKPDGTKAATAADQHVNRDTREDAELVRCVVTGEHLHVELCALAARYVGRGIPGDTVEELLRGIMLSHPDGARDERWLDRYDSIGELVTSAARKYRAESDERKKPIIRLACRLIRERKPAAEVRAAVYEAAARVGVEASTAAAIIAWAARTELARREQSHAA
jgi:hypothetical protein